MPYLVLACAVISLLLLGCDTTSERQERAENLLNAATENFIQGVETGKRVKQNIEASALDMQEKTERLQDGVEKVTDAASDFREGVAEIKGAMGGE